MTVGYFELYPDARPALPAGYYTASATLDLEATPQSGPPVNVPVDDAPFHLQVVAPRYTLPPDQILSTFPPAGAQGGWQDRLPQIVLKRRTLPWERNPVEGSDPHTAPPWLALVVLADGEGKLSSTVDVGQCVTRGVVLDADADVPKGQYLEVSQDVIDKVFPCQDELALLTHVRKVDLSDTELALGDDDGFLAVVIANRLPQPGPPLPVDPDHPTPDDGQPTSLKYTAYLINLEGQVPSLLATEPPSHDYFELADVTALSSLTALPAGTLDQLAMKIGPAAIQTVVPHGLAAQVQSAEIAYPTARGAEPAAAAWATGPSPTKRTTGNELSVVAAQRAGLADGVLQLLSPDFRFPVLVSWDFTCTGTGGFERLMNDLEVGVVGTVDPDQAAPPEVAATGHLGLDARTRHGDAARVWYRGPLAPLATVRDMPVSPGVLALAQTADELRRVIADGREDVSLAALFEIGRLLTLSTPSIVAALMSWRRELFGAARARELADLVTGSVLQKAGLAAAGGRLGIEALVRTQLVGAFTAMAPGALAGDAQLVTAARVPDQLRNLDGPTVLAGLGIDPQLAARTVKQFGADGLARLPVTVADTPAAPLSQDQAASAAVRTQLDARVDALTASALKISADRLPPLDGPAVRVRAGRKVDGLDRLITQATQAAQPAVPSEQEPS